MTARPIWFGANERRLFGWLHLPDDGLAWGSVVICPPLGRDYAYTHYAIRQLAVRLGAVGYLVLRFDYDGTGDSVGDGTDPGRVEAWLASVLTAVAYVRRSGVRRVSLIGLRFGATLAATAAERDGSIDSLVLWDPIASGRSFLREQRMLAAVAFGTAPTRDDGSVETAGFVYEASTVADLRELAISSIPDRLAAHMLVLQRPDRDPERDFVDRLASEDVVWGEATGAAQLVDSWGADRVLPNVAIDRIVAWLSQLPSADRVAAQVPPYAEAPHIAVARSGLRVVERPMALGSTGLFGMMCETPDVAKGPPVILLSVAAVSHIGPARLWVELSRRWAASGMRVVRVDTSGVGDSPAWPGQSEFVTFRAGAFDDVLEVAEAVSPDDPSEVVLVGLCASAYQVLECARVLRPRGVVAVNPMLTFRPPETVEGREIDPRRQITFSQNAMVRAFQGNGYLSPLHRRFPDFAWRARMALARERRPDRWLKELNSSGVDVLLVCGDREARPFRQGISRRNATQLTSSGRFNFVHIPGLEHGLLVAADRQRVADVLTDHILGHFGAASADEALRVERC